MINPLLITLHPVVQRVWLIFESMDTSVLEKSYRSRVDPFADSSLALRILFLPVISPPTALRITQTLVRSTPLVTDQQPSLQSP